MKDKKVDYALRPMSIYVKYLDSKKLLDSNKTQENLLWAMF